MSFIDLLTGAGGSACPMSEPVFKSTSFHRSDFPFTIPQPHIIPPPMSRNHINSYRIDLINGAHVYTYF